MTSAITQPFRGGVAQGNVAAAAEAYLLVRSTVGEAVHA